MFLKSLYVLMYIFLNNLIGQAQINVVIDPAMFPQIMVLSLQEWIISLYIEANAHFMHKMNYFAQPIQWRNMVQ